MEFHEKLQELRKQRGLTQEDLAQALYVSRTAISKWESGRGYPSIDSLKAISAYFSVTIDELLSCGEVLTIAEKEQQQKDRQLRNLIFGALDAGASALLFLPVFGQKTGETVLAVSLLSLTGIAPYMKAACFVIVIASIVWGLITIALRSRQHLFTERSKCGISLLLSAVGTLLFINCRQPYAATLMLIFLAVKVLILSRKSMTRNVSSV